MKRLSLPAIALALLAGCAVDPEIERRLAFERGQTLPEANAQQAAPVMETAPDLQRVIARYKEYLEDAPDSPEKVQSLRRLADIGIEIEERGRRARNNSEVYRAAANRYRELLALYPNYPNNDVLLYQLAKVEDLAGNITGSFEALTQLAKEYPASGYSQEAQLRRGEYLFERRDYAGAADAYQSAVKIDATTPIGQRSSFKLGWSRFKQSRYDESQDIFVDLLDGMLLVRRPLSPWEKETLEDTFRALSLSFTLTDSHASVAAMLNRKGERPFADRIYQTLGDLYRDKARIHDAADTYHAFVERYPEDARAPEFMQLIADTYQIGGFTELTVKSKREFVERFGAKSAFWARHPASVTTSARALLKAQISELAQYYHSQGQKKKAPAMLKEAVRWYRIFLESLPDDPDAPYMNFLAGEALFESGEYLAAAKEYESVAYGPARYARAADAGYAALLSYQNYQTQQSGENRALAEAQTVASSLRFVERYSADGRATPVLTRAADLLFARGELEQAVGLASRVLGWRPEPAPELRRTAYAILAHSELKRSRFADAEKYYQQVLALTPSDDPGYNGFSEGLAAAIYKQGEEARAQGDHRLAVGHFLRLGVATPQSDFRAAAQFDAAASLIALKEWKQAASVLEEFAKRFPDHKLDDKVSEQLAFCYLELGHRAKAAAIIALLAERRTDPQERRDAFWQSAELYAEARSWPEALRGYERYIALFSESLEQVTEAHQRIADIHGQQGDVKRQRERLAKIVDTVQGAQATDRMRFLAGRATLFLAEPLNTEFFKLKLAAPLKTNLKKKKDAMQAAIKAYERAAAFGIVEVTTEATFRLAEIYHQFSKDLMASERPGNLAEDELEQYNVLLEEQAFPFEEKSIEIHRANARRTVDGIYDTWVQASFKQLAQLTPSQYGKIERAEVVDNAD